ncbi:hypothetical protein JKF63_00572 [Porcisia hertigi]|uniref:Uncharacterized protein n=1 Tax=Porcisia hertigi TaxID=2761500 RepID=A0A836GYJ3_9TRYP|nr:hypothetical protein JKF63_00572 [Porcisia hertigi]
MAESTVSLPPGLTQSTQVCVNFTRDDALVSTPKVLIGTTDEGGRAPRHRESRRIQFIDDGKLFEGHFTVQSRNLKSIIQYLVDRQSEQDVIIQDLQSQVQLLRTRQVKSRQRARGDDGMLLRAAAGSSKASPGGDIGERVKSIEQFLQLWGVRLSDVAELVAEYGDPIITPDAYTSYLLDLPPFRSTRREVRALLVNASQQTVGGAAAAAVNDTAARRRNNHNPPKRELSSAGSSHDTEKKSADVATETALEKATAALEKAETLLEELRGALARPPPPSFTKARRPETSAPDTTKSSSAVTATAVDHEARADIDELGDYVMRRFQELERQSLMTAASVARAASAPRAERSGGGSGGGDGAVPAKAAAARVKQAQVKKPVVSATPPTSAPEPPPPLPPTILTPSEFIDNVAREDAAASLDLLEDLEASVERRFKEVNAALAKLAMRTASMAKNTSGGAPAVAEPEKQQQQQQQLQQRTGLSMSSKAMPSKSRSPSPGKRVEKNHEAKPVEENVEMELEDTRMPPLPTEMPPAASKVSRPPKSKAKPPVKEHGGQPITAAGVDQVAREETAALADRVGDLEEELLERWQAMEERLRIIGRAALKQSAADFTTRPGGTAVNAMSRAPVVDRKAREDAALSLMRLQLLEKELAQLKQQWGSSGASVKLPIGSVGPPTSASEGSPVMPVVSTEPRVPLRDSYGSKVTDLEVEVEQRMAEVNQAIAQLRGGPLGATFDLGAVGFKAKIRGDTDPVKGLPDLNSLPWTASLALSAKDIESLPEQGQAYRPTAASLSAFSNQSQLTLRAQEADVLSGAVTAASSSEEGPSQPVAASPFQVAFNKSPEVDSLTAYPIVEAASGTQRMIVSRLRPPGAPTFGSNLVQRIVVDLPADAEVGVIDAAGMHVCAPSGAAPAAAPSSFDVQHEIAAASRSSQLKNHTFSVSSVSGAPRGSIQRVHEFGVPAVSPETLTSSHQHRCETLGHTVP